MTGLDSAERIAPLPAIGSEHPVAWVLARVDRLLSEAVRVAAGGGTGSGADPIRGLYISDADAARLATRGLGPVGSALGVDRPLVDLERAGPRWRRVASAFGLAPVETDVLALAVAPELDLRYERIYGYLHDDLTRRRPTPDLASHLLCESFDERLAARHVFAPDAPLVRCGLVHLEADAGAPQGGATGQPITVDDGLVEFLAGGHRIDRRLMSAARWDADAPAGPPSVAAAQVRNVLQAVEDRSREPLRLLLSGPDDGAKIELARQVARELEAPLLVVDLASLGRADLPWTAAAIVVARTARLFGALTLWTHGEALGASPEAEAAGTATARGGTLEAWLAALDTCGVAGALLAAREPDARWPAEHAQRLISLVFPVPDAAERERLWSRHLARRDVSLAADETTLLGEVFRLDESGIEAVVEGAVARARWRGSPPVSRADLVQAAQARIARALPRYATRVPAAYQFDDIVLPADQLAQLRELCHRVRYRHTVLDTWGFARRLTLGRGVAALFAGPSGTGKTMAAQVMAATLGLELYRVEIPAVVSKYIGDTEKALDQLFREAQGTSVILFFDEADALFGKRSEVRDAHDRYANIEISYLLQALEQYDGLAILATNLRHNLDEAFVRRLAFTVTFPFPEEAERRRLWQRGWPEPVPLADDIDLDFLARQFKLSGGNIRNVTLASAFAAAADGGRVTMAHVVRGVRREYQKMGKVCVETDFGPWFEHLAAEAER